MSAKLTALADQLRSALETFITNPLKDPKGTADPARKNPRKKDLRELEWEYIAAFRAETKGTTPAA